MSKTIAIFGAGRGVSRSVAERFGSEGFSVALVSRRDAPLAEHVEALSAKGITAAAFAADAGQPDDIRATLARIRDSLGPISVLHWNAIGGRESGDLLAEGNEAVGHVFDVTVTGLLAGVVAALDDLRASQGAVLVTNGSLGEDSPEMDAFAVSFNGLGIAVSCAAKRKLVGMLSLRLKPEGIYVGEVTIHGAVRGTSADRGGPSVPGAAIAEKFWTLCQNRTAVRDRIAAQ